MVRNSFSKNTVKYIYLTFVQSLICQYLHRENTFHFGHFSLLMIVLFPLKLKISVPANGGMIDPVKQTGSPDPHRHKRNRFFTSFIYFHFTHLIPAKTGNVITTMWSCGELLPVKPVSLHLTWSLFLQQFVACAQNSKYNFYHMMVFITSYHYPFQSLSDLCMRYMFF